PFQQERAAMWQTSFARWPPCLDAQVGKCESAAPPRRGPSGRSDLPRGRADLQGIPKELSTVAPAQLPAVRIWKNSAEFPGTAGGGEVTDSSLTRQRTARCRLSQTRRRSEDGHDEEREEEGGPDQGG